MTHVVSPFLAGLFWAAVVPAAEFFAAPDASAPGDGSKQKPWPLQVALAQPASLQAGDLVWLRGGTYRGAFTSTLAGRPQRPIVVRQYHGERATLDCTASNEVALTVRGSGTWYWGFEVKNSSPDRVNVRGAGVSIYGDHTRFIDLIVHDTGLGFGFWSTATNSEICGCLVYHNGYQGGLLDRGHGHGIYAQNADGTKLLRDNVLFNQFGCGVHVYAEGGSIEGFDLEGNVAFNNGVLTRLGTHDANYLIGGFTPARRITLRENFGFHTLGQGGNNLQLGLRTSHPGRMEWGNGDALVEGNYLAGGSVLCQRWTNLAMVGNTFALENGSMHVEPGPGATGYAWNSNQYFLTSSTPFEYLGSTWNFADWKSQTGFDTQSHFHGGRPSQPQVFLRPNVYETRRANVIVFNWSGQDRVDIDVSQVLPKGSSYEVRNAQDFFGLPVLTGRYWGRPLSVPMTNLALVQSVGIGRRPPPSWPEFNVFILLPRPE